MKTKTTAGPLPAPFRWLWAGSGAGNLGDGMLLAAGPLMVAALSRDPLAVALAPFAQQLPWVLFGLLAGAVVDRVDRRTVMVLVNCLRCLVMGAMALLIFTHTVNLPLLYLGMFLLGTAETFADNAASSLIPNIVPTALLGTANSRLFGTVTVTNQLAGPPLGALLFGIGHALPYAGYAGLLALAAALFSRIAVPLPDGGERLPPAARTRAGTGAGRPAGHRRRLVAGTVRDVRQGMDWLRRHFAVRTLAMLVAFFNVTFGASLSMLVLYAGAQLGLGNIGYGLLLSASAVGGVLGAVVFPWLERHLSFAVLMRTGLIVETLTHLVLVLAHQAWVAMAMLFVFGVHALTWGSISATVRQRAVPDRLRGRVNSVYLLCGVGGMAVGSLLGGIMGHLWGYRAPLWFGFAGSLLILALVWRPIRHIAHAGADS